MDLETTYLSLRLGCPIVPSASPLSMEIGRLRAMEDAGAGAVVLHSLFEEQIEREAHTLSHYMALGQETYAESLTYLPEPPGFRHGPDDYLEHVRGAKAALGIPVIASLNGSTPGGWTAYARGMQEAGADAVELNLYEIPADLDTTAQDVETRHLEVVAQVRAAIAIPLAVKIGPYFSAPASMAARLRKAGADGLVLFNRFYQPDLDLVDLEVRPGVHLSDPDELLLRLRWIAILHGRLPLSLAATGGVHGHEDVLKALLVGADVAMMCSALLRRGIGHLATVRADLVRWMEEREYVSVEQLKGSMSQRSCHDPTAFERASYMKAITGYHLPAPSR
jgi:dihydroorotate dehydrogenase (fumarate)